MPHVTRRCHLDHSRSWQSLATRGLMACPLQSFQPLAGNGTFVRNARTRHWASREAQCKGSHEGSVRLRRRLPCKGPCDLYIAIFFYNLLTMHHDASCMISHTKPASYGSPTFYTLIGRMHLIRQGLFASHARLTQVHAAAALWH